MVYWLLKYIFIGPFLRLFARPEVIGIENIPIKGPVLLVSNHLAVMDSFFQCLFSPRRITFLAKSEYFTSPGLKGFLQKYFFLSVGQVPIDRSNGDAAQAAIDAVLKELDKGKVVGIYPEGTRSPDGRLYKGKTGVARIILQRNVPVIPVAMINTQKFNPPGRIIPRYQKIMMIIGKPLDLSNFIDMEGDRFIERAITDKIIFTIMKMSEQEYVDLYATDVKNDKSNCKNLGKVA